MFLRFFVTFLVLILWTSQVSAIGLTGGQPFLQPGDQSVTASPTFSDTATMDITANGANDFTLDAKNTIPQWNAYQLQGTAVSNASPTADQFFWYSASGTPSILPVTLTAGTNITFAKTTDSLTINGAATLFGANATIGTVDFSSMQPTETNGGTVDATRHTIYLSEAATKGVLFGMQPLAADWNETSDLVFEALIATPDAAEAADVVFQAKYLIIGAGKALYSSAAFTTIGTFTATLANQATGQTYSNALLKIAAASLSVGDRIHLRFDRIGADAGDTHGDNLHFVAVKGTYTR